MLATGGGLVFLGGADIQAFNALTGRRLWQLRTNYGRAGVPTTYAVNKVQYVAVMSGSHPQAYGGGTGPGANIPRGGLVWAFALDCQC